LPSPASAQFVTTTFNGTVVDNGGFGPTTSDFADPFGFYPNGPFGGGDLIGLPFTLRMTIDVSTTDGVGIGNANFFTGANSYLGGYPYGGLYGCCNPMTSSLTINGQTLVFDDQTGFLPLYFTINSDGSTNPNELQLQTFYWSQLYQGSQYFAIALDLVSTNPVFGADFTAQLPTLLAGGDFTVNYAAFYTIGGEVQNLGITSLVGSVPEPSTWAMMALGFASLAGAAARRREPAAIA
jgi:hypothetical protein